MIRFQYGVHTICGQALSASNSRQAMKGHAASIDGWTFDDHVGSFASAATSPTARSRPGLSLSLSIGLGIVFLIVRISIWAMA